MPTSMIATISREVATGRRINSRDGLTPYSYPWPPARSASPATAPARLRRAWRRRGTSRLALPLSLALTATPRAARLAGILSRRRVWLRRVLGNGDLSAFLEPIGAVGDDHLARFEPFGNRDLLPIVRAERHRLRGYRIVGLDDIDKRAG